MGHRTKPTDLRRTIDPQNRNPSPADYDNNPEMSKTLYASHFKKNGIIFNSSKRFPDASIFRLIQTTKYQDQVTTRIILLFRVWEST